MFHMHDATWTMIGREDPSVDRNRAHLVALREAQTATDYRAAVDRGMPAQATVRRLALATGTGSNVDLAACCA